MKRGTAVNVGIVVVAIAGGVFASLKPWNAYRDQRAAADRQTAAMRKAERDRAVLLKQQADADNPVGQEIQARKHGFVRQGQQLADTP